MVGNAIAAVAAAIAMFVSEAEDDRLTTATQRTLLAHNELYEEFCRDD